MNQSIRGAAAVVGVADEVSPSGVIDLPLRELELASSRPPSRTRDSRSRTWTVSARAPAHSHALR